SLNAVMFGSPASEVAEVVVPLVVATNPLNVIRFAKLSFAGACASALPTNDKKIATRRVRSCFIFNTDSVHPRDKQSACNSRTGRDVHAASVLFVRGAIAPRRYTFPALDCLGLTEKQPRRFYNNLVADSLRLFPHGLSKDAAEV